MKTYEQTTNNILQRVEALQAAKVKRNRRILSVTTSLGCVAVITLLGNVIWLRGNHQAPPQPSGSVVTDPNNDPAPQDAPVVDVPASKEESKVESKAESKVESIVESEPKKPVESEPKDEQPMDTPLVDEPDDTICDEDEIPMDNSFDSIDKFNAFLKNKKAVNDLQKDFLNIFQDNGSYYYQPVLGEGNDLLKFASIEGDDGIIRFYYYTPTTDYPEASTLSISACIQLDEDYKENYETWGKEAEEGNPDYKITTVNGIEYHLFFNQPGIYLPNDVIVVVWEQHGLYHRAALHGHDLELTQILPLLNLKKVEIK